MKYLLTLHILLFIILFTYPLASIIHEITHIIIMKKNNIGIEEVCVLGYRNETDANWYQYGWVRPLETYNDPLHDIIDLNFTK